MRINRYIRECDICRSRYNKKDLLAMELKIESRVRLMDKIAYEDDGIRVLSTYPAKLDICPECSKHIVAEICLKTDKEKEDK